jgi:hypothetical protein
MNVGDPTGLTRGFTMQGKGFGLGLAKSVSCTRFKTVSGEKSDALHADQQTLDVLTFRVLPRCRSCVAG